MGNHMRIFIMCPVRNAKPETNDKIAAYVAKLESEGYEVYWPHRDNPYQKTDPIGLEIILCNREKMVGADEIHIWYDKDSTGSIFDLGMFFALVRTQVFKKFVIINRDDIEPTSHKSFENIVLAFEKRYRKG